MEKKYKTLNNWVSKKIVDNLISENFRAVFYLLYNCGELLESEVQSKTVQIIVCWFDMDLDRMETTAKELCGYDVSSFIERIVDYLRVKYDINK